jgi:hypothetical protein
MSLLFQCAEIDLKKHLLKLFLLNNLLHPVGIAFGTPSILVVSRGRV